MKDRVIVLGGGVAGMSAAHELIERGFQVTVYEKKGIPGGKARSLSVPNTRKDRRRDLPAEHGFRFFPGFYIHLPDTMKRIPYKNNPNGVFDNLVETSQIEINFRDQRHVVVPSRFPRSLSDLRDVLVASGYLDTQTGLTDDDIEFYVERIWQILTSCEERRAEEFERISWWEYVEADKRSEIYQKYLGGSTRVLVAADPRLANTKTVGDILLQMLFHIIEPGVGSDRVLNGPTNDVWIDPWLAHLEGRGVRYHRNACAMTLRCAEGKIGGVRIVENGREREETADFYVAALPVEVMARLVTPEMLAIDPTLEGILILKKDVAWMTGIQFYLTQDLPLAYGHQMHLDSLWALTSLSQAQFWRDTCDLPRDFGDGTVKGIISVDISEWHARGLNGKRAVDCTRDEVGCEVWAELKQSLKGLEDRHLHSCFLDPDIEPRRGRLTNVEPLLVNRVNSWQFRPEARTRVPNLFLASDYVRTYTSLATMEAANEAARRAVNAIIDAAGARVVECEVWNLHEPLFVKPWRWWDRIRYRNGKPWDAEFPAVVRAAVRAVLAGLASPESAYSDWAERRRYRRAAANPIGSK